MCSVCDMPVVNKTQHMKDMHPDDRTPVGGFPTIKCMNTSVLDPSGVSVVCVSNHQPPSLTNTISETKLL